MNLELADLLLSDEEHAAVVFAVGDVKRPADKQVMREQARKTAFAIVDAAYQDIAHV